MRLILIICAANLFFFVIFGSLYFGSKSLGFWVPGGYVPLETILNVPLDDRIAYGDKNIEAIEKIGDERIAGPHEGKMLKIRIEEEPVIVAAVYWPAKTDALNFWKRYYRSIGRLRVRKKAFRNNIWDPRFVTGRFGRNAEFDISAWHQDNWFFLVAASTRIKGFNQVKSSFKNLVVDHMKRISYKEFAG